jgi:hypothetical protein
MAISTVAGNALVAGLFGDNRNPTAPATWYFALSSTAPTVDTYGVISGITEPTTGSYARIAYTNTSAHWSITNGVATNLSQIVFPIISGAKYDNKPLYVVVFSVLSGGSALWSYSLGATLDPDIGSNVILDIGFITFTAIEGI